LLDEKKGAKSIYPPLKQIDLFGKYLFWKKKLMLCQQTITVHIVFDVVYVFTRSETLPLKVDQQTTQKLQIVSG
jgi:hypothetical protein